ncbi:hypothetical protein HYU95_03175 [Candidatus Daviesbacteria bacterium]|nr:hypothetical protein [Candidatus Daviesbacteria bacterium]
MSPEDPSKKEIREGERLLHGDIRDLRLSKKSGSPGDADAMDESYRRVLEACDNGLIAPDRIAEMSVEDMNSTTDIPS